MFSRYLKVSEIFFSLQGENIFQGFPTVFIRLSGCPMRCSWCDTRYAFWEGKYYEVGEVLQRVGNFSASYVCITGGEPLGQQGVYFLMEELLRRGYGVSLETGGGFLINRVPGGVVKVLDIKCPSSGESGNMVWENVDYLGKGDQVKFVVKDRSDFDWALGVVDRYGLLDRVGCWVSPVYGALELERLASWILECGQRLRLNVQLHKWIWGNQRGR